MTDELTIVSEVYAHVATAFEADNPDVTLVLENQPFNWADPPQRFVEFEVKLYDGNQIGMSDSPATRYVGYAYACVYAKSGLGTLESLRLAMWFRSRLAYQRVGSVKFQAGHVADAADNLKGWHTLEFKVPFYAD